MVAAVATKNKADKVVVVHVTQPLLENYLQVVHQ
jgi:hypothetical protein